MTTYVFSLPTVDADGETGFVGIVSVDPDGMVTLYESGTVCAHPADAERVAWGEWSDRVREVLAA
jgi:hypothetical protein